MEAQTVSGTHDDEHAVSMSEVTAGVGAAEHPVGPPVEQQPQQAERRQHTQPE